MKLIIFLVFIANFTFAKRDLVLEARAIHDKGQWQQVITFDKDKLTGFSNGNYLFPTARPVLLGKLESVSVTNIKQDLKFLNELNERLNFTIEALNNTKLINKSKSTASHSIEMTLNGKSIPSGTYWHKRALDILKNRWLHTEWKIVDGKVYDEKAVNKCTTSRSPCFIKERGWIWQK